MPVRLFRGWTVVTRVTRATIPGVIDPPAKLKIVERRAGGIVVLGMSGALTLDDGDLTFRQHIHTLLEEGHNRILLDLEGVTTVDSAGVGMLVAKLNTVRDHGGEMKLLHLSTRGSRVLNSMKVLSAFESFEEESVALRSFDKQPIL
jgi:anti-sigma B factor antagonist